MATVTAYSKAQSDTLLGAKAPLASPAFTGTPTIGGQAVLKSTSTIRRVGGTQTANFASNQYVGGGTNLGLNGRQSQLTPAVGGNRFELFYADVFGIAEGRPAGTSLAVRAAIEYPAGTFTEAYSSDGNRDITLVPGGIGKLFCDIEIPATTQYWVRSRILCTTADGMPVGVLGATANGDWGATFTSGAPDFTTTNTSAPAANTTYCFGPTAITMMPTKPVPCVYIGGDSISRDTGETKSGFTDTAGGWAVRTLSSDATVGRAAPRVPFINESMSGELVSNLASIAKRQRRVALGTQGNPTAALILCGTNDVLASGTAGTIEANQVLYWSALAARGMAVWAATLPPCNVTSTDSFATTANQTAGSNDAARTAVNDWIRDGAPISSTALTPVAVGTSTGVLRAGTVGHPLAGYIETADTVESARNSGLWKVNGTANAYAFNGTHPSPLGHQVMAQAAQAAALPSIIAGYSI